MHKTPRAMLAAALGEAEQEYRAAQLSHTLHQIGSEARLNLAREKLRHLHRVAMTRGEEATGEIILPPEVLRIR